MSCCDKDKPEQTPAEKLARTREAIDVSFQNGHPAKAAQQRWFRCTHSLACGMCACEHLAIVAGEEATCELTTGIDSFKNAIQRRDFRCPDVPGRF